MYANQIKKILFHLFILQFLFFYEIAKAGFTLDDLLDAEPDIKSQKPSVKVSGSLIGKDIHIKDAEYQIRSFVFEAKPMDNLNLEGLTFGEFVNKHNLQNTPAKKDKPQIPPISPRASLYPTYSLLKTFNDEESGTCFHYMIVLGKTKDRNH